MSVVTLEQRGAVAILTLDRPKALNALNAEVLQGIDGALDALTPETRVLILTGGGEKAFVAGADISQMATFTPAEALHFAGLGQKVLDRLEALNIPTIAAVNGFALGGGCELAMACDLIYASPTAVFGQPEVKLGVIPGFGGTQRLVRRVGSQRARELILTARNVKAPEAVQLGLALGILEPNEKQSFLEQVVVIAENMAKNGPVALQLAKRAILDTDGVDLRSGLIAERNLFALCFATADQKEGMAAFLNKRPAAFTGK